MPRTTALLIAGITVCSVIVILVILANRFMRRHTLGAAVVLSLALSGFPVHTQHPDNFYCETIIRYKQ